MKRLFGEINPSNFLVIDNNMDNTKTVIYCRGDVLGFI